VYSNVQKGATKYTDPRIWTAERDIEMWRTLEG
jgi:hypothetical protein